jgi:hypothetical protein
MQEPPLTPPPRARRVDVALQVVFSAHQSHYFAQSANVSETGLFLVTKRGFTAGTPLHVVFGAPPRLPRISADGVIRWTKEHEGIGVELTSLTTEQKQALHTFLDSNPN